MNYRTPILFLIFNRPIITRIVFNEIKKIKPSKLFIAADGPRSNKPGEDILCNETRSIINEIDWECELKTLFRDDNLGCGKSVSSSISWFFDHVEEGIILEDDCCPDSTFFPYCQDLLNRYRNDRHIFAIAGNNNAFKEAETSIESYSFSKYPLIWGWATWKRAWQNYDFNISCWPDKKESKWLKSIFANKSYEKFWHFYFDFVYAHHIDTWDYQWTYCCLSNEGLCIIPKSNLISNIGASLGTHTHKNFGFLNLPRKALDFPIQHNNNKEINYKLEDVIQKRVFGKSNLIKQFYWKLLIFKKRLAKNIR